MPSKMHHGPDSTQVSDLRVACAASRSSVSVLQLQAQHTIDTMRMCASSKSPLSAVRVFAHATSAAFPIQVSCAVRIGACRVAPQSAIGALLSRDSSSWVQDGPGDVDYRALLGLDFVIAEAQAQGLLLSTHDCYTKPRRNIPLALQYLSVSGAPLTAD